MLVLRLQLQMINFSELLWRKNGSLLREWFDPYFADDGYIEALATSVRKGYETAEVKPDVLVCSYHGVPKRYLMEGDPYHCQCQKTTRLLKES